MSDFDFADFLNDDAVREFVDWNEANPVGPIESPSNNQPDMVGANAAMQEHPMPNPSHDNATMDEWWTMPATGQPNVGEQQFAYGQDQGLQQPGFDQSQSGIGQDLQISQPQPTDGRSYAFPWAGLPEDYARFPTDNLASPPLAPGVVAREDPAAWQHHPLNMPPPANHEATNEDPVDSVLRGESHRMSNSGVDFPITKNGVQTGEDAQDDGASLPPAGPNPPRAPKAVLPKPQSNAANESAAPKDDQAEGSLVTVPTVPITKGGAKKRSTTYKKTPAERFPIFTDELLVSSLAEATKETTNLIQLAVWGDDRDDVARHPKDWVPRITKAFEHHFKAKPDDGTQLTPEGQAEWTRWQTEHENEVWGIFKKSDDPSRLAQASAYIFYQLVLDAHEVGKGLAYVAKTISNSGPDITMKCSERLEAAIKALEDYSIVQYDFLKQERLGGLAASPQGFAQRKIDNMFVNYKKAAEKKAAAKKDGEEAKRAKVEPSQDDGTTKKGRKRKAAQTPTADDEEDEEDASEDDPDAAYTPAPARKKAKATSKRSSKKSKD